ncbi:MAG: regulatory protein RecX, partial [Clostridiales bacterium]|nr:regulatory protein RecX [Clostridiales bacterium]
MTVTRIEARRAGLRIHVDGAPVGLLDPLMLSALGLFTGAALSEAQFEQLCREVQLFEARQSALASLARQAQSGTGLLQRLLRKGFTREAAEQAVAHCDAMGYLDDLDFARSAAQKLQAKGYGRRRIADALHQKGVPRELIGQALEELPADRETLRLQLEGRLAGTDWADRAARDRALRALQRQGYSYEDI